MKACVVPHVCVRACVCVCVRVVLHVCAFDKAVRDYEGACGFATLRFCYLAKYERDTEANRARPQLPGVAGVAMRR